MQIEVEISPRRLAPADRRPDEFAGRAGAVAEFRGVVRTAENGQIISALEYEAYQPMAEREIRRILESLAEKFPCLGACVHHRIGVIPAGETAIYVGIAAAHRAEAFALLAGFMDRLKQDVPIWKRRSLPQVSTQPVPPTRSTSARPISLDEALAALRERCAPLPSIQKPLTRALGQVLREAVLAREDSPACDRSTRDGYAVRADDPAESFSVVDTLTAADWRPRALKSGEAVRVSTGTALPGEQLRVVMQEQVERTGNIIRVMRREPATHVRRRGEEYRTGEPLLASGTRLDAAALALLASAGCTQPAVSPCLRVSHFTTGDEIVPPERTPLPGQIRDSNSILIRGLLHPYGCELEQAHLPEEFGAAWAKLETTRAVTAEVVLISGGSSVGEKDCTRALLEQLGFEIVFSRVNLRPGAPLIFGVNGARVAFGLPGNPLSHFVCFHFAVVTALARLTGAGLPAFRPGTLAGPLDDPPHSRETLWPARLETGTGRCKLTPLRWNSSSDLAVLAATNALIRVPSHDGSRRAGDEVQFLPVPPGG